MAALSAFGSPEGFDIVFECTGAESAIQMSVFVSPSYLFLCISSNSDCHISRLR